MSNVPTNLIPTKVTGLPEYFGSSTLGYLPYIIDGRTYKVQFANIAAVGAVPSTREINTGSGLGGGGDLSTNRTLYILPGGVDDSRLSVTGVVPDTYGTANSIPSFTVNAQGRVTGVTNTPIVLSNYVPISRTITAGAGLSGGGDLSTNRTLSVNFSSVSPEPLGPGSPGVSTVAAREDHVHPAVDLSDTTETQGVLPLSRGGTGNSLSPVVGAIAYSGSDKMYLTPTAGDAGQVLVSAGGVAPPFWQSLSGLGTVTSVAVATANGFAGTVADPTTTPIITLSTTVTGLLKGNGTGVSAATAGVDYVGAGPYTTSGLTMASARLLGRTTASIGAAEEITVGSGLTFASGSLANAAPDQVVSLTGAGTTTITGAYPSFTITSADSTIGTVTSVNASGGTTGLSFTGGPITAAGTLTLGGTLAIASGGTGAADAATALTNLGAYPASNPAGYTTNIGTVTSVSGTGTVSGLSLSGTVTSSGSLTLGGTLAVLPSNFASQTANTVLAAPNGTAGVPTFRSLVAADVPILNQNTTGTASNVTGIVAVANGGTGASVAATARTNLGAAASGANTDITSITLTTGTISTTPTGGTDIVNKAYADSIASGINFHQSVRLATTTTLPAYTYNNGTSGVGATLTANANGALSIDGVAVAATNRVLIKNEIGAAQAYNGVYTVTQTGNGSTPYILTRATDFDTAGTGVNKIDAGDFFLVTAGSTQANTSWVQQTPLPIVVGTTAIVFTQFAAPVLYSAGTGLTLTGTVFSITNTGVSASTYGSASSVPVLAINAQGQVTSASSSSIAITASQITSGALAIANGGTGATDAATALANLGAYPASNPNGYTSNTGTVTSVNLTAGTGVSVSGGPITTTGAITVTNTAPDQVVSLTGSGATTVTGTYPNFTISSPAGGTGTVTSIDVSGGTTGLTTSGGPVTGSGTITFAGTLNIVNGGTGATSAVTALSNLGAYPATNPNGYLSTVSLTTNVTGTLSVANGGTGATTLTSGYLVKGNGTAAVSASVVYDNGTNVGIGTTVPRGDLSVGTNSSAANTQKSIHLGYTASDFYGFRLLNINSPGLTGAGTFSIQRGTGAAWSDTLLVDNFGSLGIGTVPSAGLATETVKLDVLSGDTGEVMFRTTGSIASGTGAIQAYFGGSNNIRSAYVGFGGLVNTFDVWNNLAGPMTFGTSNAERMRILSGGNVGIGTATPAEKLQVVGGIRVNTTGTVYSNTFSALNTHTWLVNNASSTDTYLTTDTAQRYRMITSIGHQWQTAVSGTAGTAVTYTERMRLDLSGNLLVGTTVVDNKLTVSASSSGAAAGILSLVNPNDAAGTAADLDFVCHSTGTLATGRIRGLVNGPDDYPLAFYTYDGSLAERMRINAFGNVGIGTASPAYTLSVVDDASFTKAAADAFSSIIYLNKGRGSVAAPANINSGDNLGSVFFSGYSGSVNNGGYGYGASIGGQSDGAINATTVPGRLTFSTTTSGNSSPTERMRINSSGNLLVGNTNGTSKVTVTGVVESTTGGFKFPDATTQTTASTGTVTSVGGTGTVNGITLTGTVTTSGNLTLGGTLSGVSLTTQVSGTLPVLNGGTGVTTSTGSGSVVLSTSPTLVTPILGAASATSVATGLGAAATPSHTFTGNTNTGMWSPATDTIAFSEGGVEAMRLHSSGGVSIGNTVDTGAASLNVTGNVVFQDRVYTEMMAPAQKALAATLTGAEVMGGHLIYTGSAATLTMPTATNLQAAMPAAVAALNNISFDFTITNTGAATVTLAVNTGITANGSLLTTATQATTWRIRKTATNTFIMYRT